MKKSFILTVCFALVAFAACEKPYEYPTYEEEELPAIELIAPAVDAVVDLESVDEVVFEWSKLEVNSFKLLFSLSEDMSNAKEIAAKRINSSGYFLDVKKSFDILCTAFTLTTEFYKFVT